MIVDTLSNAKQYFSLHPDFEAAFAALATLAPTLPDGEHPLEGSENRLIIAQGEFRLQSEAALEVHNRYIDIQFSIRGVESFGWRPRKRCYTPQGEFNTEKDIQFYDDQPSGFATITPGEFVIFFPEDAHAPLIGKGEFKKAIVKVKL